MATKTHTGGHRTAKQLAEERKQAEQEIAARKRKRPARKTSPADVAIVEAAKKFAPKTPTWPAQVAKIRKAIGKRDVLEAIGLSKKDLRAYAKGEAVDVPLTGLREISAATGDPYCSGRRLAAALLALVEEES